MVLSVFFFFFQEEDGIRVSSVTGVQTCALPISAPPVHGRGRDRPARLPALSGAGRAASLPHGAGPQPPAGGQAQLCGRPIEPRQPHRPRALARRLRFPPRARSTAGGPASRGACRLCAAGMAGCIDGGLAAGHATAGEGGAMSWLLHEWRLLTRSRLALCALALLLLLSTLAVLSGLREIASQRLTLDRLAQLQQQDMAAQASRPAQARDAGSVAYYGFHATWDAPSSTAFLALRSEEHTSELQSHLNLVCRLLLEKKKNALPFPARLLSHHH